MGIDGRNLESDHQQAGENRGCSKPMLSKLSRDVRTSEPLPKKMKLLAFFQSTTFCLPVYRWRPLQLAAYLFFRLP